jgi:hypothetical protein
LEAWRLEGLKAWRLGGLKAWRLEGLKAWAGRTTWWRVILGWPRGVAADGVRAPGGRLRAPDPIKKARFRGPK